MTSNWMELGLTKDEEELVARGAALYRAAYVDTIDNAFAIGRALKILQDRHRGSGIRGGFPDALVQYGFTSRDGGPMSKSIVSAHTQCIDNEAAIRTWWDSVPERKKRLWLSAKAILTNWRAWKEKQERERDPNAPKKRSAWEEMKATNITLQEELQNSIDETKKLKMADGGSHFDLAGSNPDDVSRSIRDAWKTKLSWIERVIDNLTADLKELKALHKTARPKAKPRKRNAIAGS
jgi:hypothetical protein